VVVGLEILFRIFEPTLFDASHRALFKMAVLDRKPDVNVVVVGSSRHELGFRPAQFDARTRALGRSFKSFNLAVSGLSSALETYLLGRLSGKKLDLLIVEFDGPALGHTKLDWTGPRSNIALLRLRSVLRHDNLARLATIGLASHRFDGSEIAGPDYIQTLRYGHDATCEACENVYPLPTAGIAADVPLRPELQAYLEVLRPIRTEGTRILLIAPPISAEHHDIDRTPAFQTELASLALALDSPFYNLTDLAPSDLKDTQHLNPRGAGRYTDLLARLAAGNGN